MGDMVRADDVISDVCLKFFEQMREEEWPDLRIFLFSRGCGRLARKSYIARRERSLGEMDLPGYDGEWMCDIDRFVAHATKPVQHTHAEAAEALGWLGKLPPDQRVAMGILVDGGNPVDVAKEMGLPIRDALLLIYDARYNIHRV